MEMNSTITLNGVPHPLESTVSLEILLDSIGLAGKPVVIELNEHAVFPRDYPQITIHQGDRIEIVTLAAGG